MGIMGGSVWMWAWALVAIRVGALKTMYATGNPTECMSIALAPQTTYTASSTIHCAAIGSLKGAQKYIFNGSNTCTLVGEGLTLATSGPRTYLSVSPGLQQVATGKPTYASPYLYGSSVTYVPSLAVDGNMIVNTMYHSKFALLYPWWVVDLGAVRTIHEIQILSRVNCCFERFHNVEIRVGSTFLTSGNFSFYVLFSTYLGPYAAADGFLTCPRAEGVFGRYVSIQRVTPEDDPLQLVEVYVFATTL